MALKKTVSCPFSRLVANSAMTRTSLSVESTVSRDKKADSTTLLSPDSAGTYLTLDDIPGPRPSIPFIGTAWQYFPGGRYNLSNLHEACVDKYLRYGPIVREEFQWRKPVVHLYRPKDFEDVFRMQGKMPMRPISEFVKHYRLSNPDKYDSPGLANSVGEEWLRLKTLLMPVLLNDEKLNYLHGSVNDICDDFTELLRAVRCRKTFVVNDLQDVVYRLALEAIYMMSLDCRLDCLKVDLRPDTPAFAMIYSVKLLFEAFQELYYGLPLWKFFKTSSYKKLDKAESIMYDAASRRIEEAIEKIRHEDREKRDREISVLQTLIECKDISDKEIKASVIDFISGGIFTVTNAFTFLLYHLSRNQDVQEKLYREISDFAKDSVITKETLDKLRYLKACVKESFRLTPTIPTITRILSEDIILSGYHIPAG
ncbi:Ecdysone 20-monooxygenase, partial [Stegodyphus mimosarum]